LLMSRILRRFEKGSARICCKISSVLYPFLPHLPFLSESTFPHALLLAFDVMYFFQILLIVQREHESLFERTMQNFIFD
jgi:hypothetical protein